MTDPLPPTAAPSRLRLLQRVLAVLVLLLGMTGAVTAWQWDALVHGWWDWRSEHALGPIEAEALDRCEPRWWTVRRMLAQDLDADCDLFAQAEVIASRLSTRRRVAWLAKRLGHPSERTRARSLLALAIANEALPDDASERLSALFEVDELRADLLSALLGDQLPTRLLHPSLEAVALDAQLVDDAVPDERLVHELLLAAGAPSLHAPRLAVLHRVTLHRTGLEVRDVVEQGERRGRGRGFGAVPEHAVAPVSDALGRCRMPADSGCQLFLADALASMSDLGTLEPSAPGRVPATGGMAWLRPLYEVDPAIPPASIEPMLAWIGRRATWVAAAADADARASRLERLVMAPESGFTGADAQAGHTGDPVEVLVRGGGSAWATAIAAVVVGRSAGVRVEASEHEEGAVVAIGRRPPVRVGPCGERATVETAGLPMSDAAILARAARERAEGYARAGDVVAAGALAGLVGRLDRGLVVRTSLPASTGLVAQLGGPSVGLLPPSACTP